MAIITLKNQTIVRARREINAVLKRYRINWEDIAPDKDRDALLWQKTEPTARVTRRKLFQKRYPSLYASRHKK